ncbi:MAG: DUF4124 domain-containing protein [Chromatiaceae bacterium]|nr:DUF4124 domain-containing protein [Chromatiaceae bacterium]
MHWIISILSIPLLLLSLAPCRAEVWRCEGFDGQVYYQQEPCAQGADSRPLEVPEAFSEEAARAAERRLARDLEYLEALEERRARERERAAERALRERELELEQRRIEALERQAEELERQNEAPRTQILILPRPPRPWPHGHPYPPPPQPPAPMPPKPLYPSHKPDLPRSLPPILPSPRD